MELLLGREWDAEESMEDARCGAYAVQLVDVLAARGGKDGELVARQEVTHAQLPTVVEANRVDTATFLQYSL